MDDIERMIALGRRMHAESRFSAIPYDEDKLRGYGEIALARPHEWGVFFVPGEATTLAMMAVYKTPYYFSQEVFYATDLFLYVDASKRGGLSAARCLRAVEDWGRANEVHALHLGISAAINNEAAERFYAGMGYTPSGRTMVKEL